MIKRLFLIIFLIVFFLIPLHACKDTGADRQASVFKQVPEIQNIKPQKPVKIKLKRNTKGEYSWDLSGDNADKIIKADKKLYEGLQKSAQ